ncbi:hypothetical protein [Synechococcus sp. C9]|uniref:hypothetical protein n=2 Tax=Synechococcus sp. C9 TaxID=102119 RepID=UPI001FF6F91A|nr:hypothetical protein [Synechococcus sp. C9]
MTMWNDPIIEELHKIRADRDAQFNGDLTAMLESLKTIEQEWLLKFPKLMSGEIRVAEQPVKDVL